MTKTWCGSFGAGDLSAKSWHSSTVRSQEEEWWCLHIPAYHTICLLFKHETTKKGEKSAIYCRFYLHCLEILDRKMDNFPRKYWPHDFWSWNAPIHKSLQLMAMFKVLFQLQWSWCIRNLCKQVEFEQAEHVSVVLNPGKLLLVSWNWVLFISIQE